MQLRRTRRTGVLCLAGALAAGLMAAPAAADDAAHDAADRAAVHTAAVSAQDDDEIEPRDLSAACPEGRVPDSDFPDAAAPFTQAIECLVWYEVTQGRPDGSYGPDAGVTRGQMALFLHRLLAYNLGGEAVPGGDEAHDFSDIPGEPAELTTAVNALSSETLAEFLDLEGPIVRGLGDDRYGPDQPVRRDQMASFVARVFDGLLHLYDGRIVQQGFCPFTDSTDIPEAHRSNVNLVCGFGIATGRQDGSYGPAAPVTRGQMAAFLMRTQDIVADEPFYALVPDQDVVTVDRDACGDAADGSATAPYCTIQEGVDDAGATDRVLVVSSEELYVEDVDLGTGGIELFGVPIESDGGLLPLGVEGAITGDPGGERILIGRMHLFVPEGETGVSLQGDGRVALASMRVDDAVTGIDVQAATAQLDAVGVYDADVSVRLDVDAGDIRGGSFFRAQDAYVVDVADTLDLEDILERTGSGVSNLFSPAGELGTFEGSPAIVPEG